MELGGEGDRRARAAVAAEPGGDPAGEDGDVDGVLVQLRVALGERPQQHGAALARLGALATADVAHRRSRLGEQQERHDEAQAADAAHLRHAAARTLQVMATEIKKTDAEWREELTPEQYHILREAGTERAFSGEYWNSHDDGVFRCAACGAELFDSTTKFESGSGWPSFTEPKIAEAVETRRDISHGMIRTEVVCRRCGGHLGHVFDDGPSDQGGLRYCINSAALDLETR